METKETKIVVASVGAHQFKPELDSAELRVVVTTSYPTRQTNSDGLFTTEEYGLESQDFESNRVCWIDVPKGTTIAQVQAKIDALPNARIQRILSMKAILGDNQIAAIEKGITTLDVIEESQKVRDEEGNVVEFNGKEFYKKLQFSAHGKADIDMRPTKMVAKIEENVEVAAAAQPK